MSEIHLILIGDELLSGKRQDLHLKTIAGDLAARGAELSSCEIVADKPGNIADSIRRHLAPGAAIITTGGLGPTLDDLTRVGISEATGVELEEDPNLWEELKNKFAKTGRKIPEINRTQTLVPRSGTFFPNPNGTAPGLVFEPPSFEGCCVIALPGPPRELVPMWRDSALPYLAERFKWTALPLQVLLRFAGIGESGIDEKMRPLLEPHADIGLSSLIQLARVDVTLSLPADYKDGRRILSEIAKETQSRLLDYLYETSFNFENGDSPALELEQVITGLLRERGETLATAESCTGGLIGKLITDYGGSSDVFRGGIISYHNDLKNGLLGVEAVTLEKEGAVSERVVNQMVGGVLKMARADWGIAVSGVAGPSGGSEEKPVGLVWIGVGKGDKIDTHRRMIPGDREAIRERAATTALRMIWLRLRESK